MRTTTAVAMRFNRRFKKRAGAKLTRDVVGRQRYAGAVGMGFFGPDRSGSKQKKAGQRADRAVNVRKVATQLRNPKFTTPKAVKTIRKAMPKGKRTGVGTKGAYRKRG